MYLSKISIGAKNLNFNNCTNILTGFTGKGKTFYYNAIVYAFCLSGLDISIAKKKYKADFVQLDFNDDNNIITIIRYFSISFKGKINSTEYTNIKDYKNKLNEIFFFNSAQILDGEKVTIFQLNDLIDMFFVPESQLTSQKNIFEKNGFSDFNKRKSFFDYILTGEKIESNNLKQNAKYIKNERSISKIPTTYNRLYSKPTKTQYKEYEKLTNDIELLKQNIIINNEKINDYQRLVVESEYMNTRLNSLLMTYQEDYRDLGFAEIFQILEETNNEKISRIDQAYCENLNNNIVELKDSISDCHQKIKVYKDEINRLNQDNRDNNERIEKLLNDRSEYDFIKAYDEISLLQLRLKEKNNEKYYNDKSKYEEKINEISLNSKNERELLCEKISTRIGTWGLTKFKKVNFDQLQYDLTFDGERLKTIPKGYKSILSLAVSVEILLNAIEKNVWRKPFLICDTIWVASDFEDVDIFNIKEKIIKDLNKLPFKVIIMENENKSKKVESAKYISIK